MGGGGGSNKHGYTEEELEAAVANIRGGKLGTRRASSLYGIPRSTLRNKIFRSGPGMMDRGPAFLDPEDSNSGDEAMAAAVTSGMMKMTDLVQAGAFPYLPHLPFPLAIGVGGSSSEEQDYCCSSSTKAVVFDEFSIKLEHIRRMHNLKGDRELQIKPAHINEPRLPLLSTLIRRLVEQRFQMEVSAAGHGQGLDGRVSDTDVARGRANSPVIGGERKSMAISVDTLPHFLPYLPAFSPSCLSLSVPSSFEDLRIPSYKPANVQQHQHQQSRAVEAMDEDSRPFGKVYETSRIGETLKDIIVKSISEKIKFQDVDAPVLFPGAGDLFSQAFSLKDAFPLSLGKSAFRSCHSDLSQPTHPAKRIKREPYDDQDTHSHSAKCSGDSSRSKPSDYRGHGSGESKSSSSSSSGAKSGGGGGESSSVKEKKTRPKRGQYRKYNSQLLIEAVRAVQRGEMSVHRAGSYFGVPHSTLEYKVKERHLLRQKKTRDAGAATSSSSSSAGGPAGTSSSAAASASSTATPNASSSTTTTTTLTSTPSSSTASSTTQTSKAYLNVTSAASSDSTASSSASSSSSQTPLGGSSISIGIGKAEAPAPPLPTTSPLSSSSLSALGFGLHNKQAGAGAAEFPWFQPYLLSGASPSPFDPTLSLFPQGFALNTSASELLRKLQHKVQGKSSPSSPFSSESSFGFAHPNGSSSLREGFLLFN